VPVLLSRNLVNVRYVGFGSKAEVVAGSGHFRFAPDNGHHPENRRYGRSRPMTDFRQAAILQGRHKVYQHHRKLFRL
jgi:hypothetical protein